MKKDKKDLCLDNILTSFVVLLKNDQFVIFVKYLSVHSRRERLLNEIVTKECILRIIIKTKNTS